MLGPAVNTLCHVIIEFSQEGSVVNSNSPILKMRNLRLQEVNDFLKVTQLRSAGPKFISPKCRAKFPTEMMVKNNSVGKMGHK